MGSTNKTPSLYTSNGNYLAASRAIRYKSSRHSAPASPALWAFHFYPWPKAYQTTFAHTAANARHYVGLARKHNRPGSMSLQYLYTRCLLLILLGACSTKHEHKHQASSVKFEQYYLQGQQLYQTHCSNCHQKDGTGLGLLYPPLNKSDFVDNHKEKAICIIKFGKEGELIVNGKSFNKKMPGNVSLTALEVAEIATYIFNTWSHYTDTLYSVNTVEQILSQCNNTP